MSGETAVAVEAPAASSSGRTSPGFFSWLFMSRREREALAAEQRDDKYCSTLAAATQEDWSDLEQLGFLQTGFDDKSGRPVVMVFAKNFPAKVVRLERLRRYIIFKLDAEVDEPYVLIWLHTKATYFENSPGLSWLWRTYESFPEKYRSNLERMYVVHCDLPLWVAISFTLPWFSERLWRKVEWVSRVEFLEDVIAKPVLLAALPAFVKEHDSILEDQPLHDYGVVASKEMSMLPGMPAPLQDH